MSKKETRLEIIPFNVIDVSKTNPRKSIEEKSFKELTESIKQHGVLQPIIVRPKAKPKSKAQVNYELVCGERRFKAGIQAGLKDFPCNVLELSDEEAESLIDYVTGNIRSAVSVLIQKFKLTYDTNKR